ncbi:MAG TPA: hypothetical protein VNB22_14575 [Pyrinomonadaceae bacterium]|nr:hypothetical protein [Pyrinomonadaceae bacterium]
MTITYTDPNVDLTGFVRMEFRQMPFDSKLFEWRSYQISVSETP